MLWVDKTTTEKPWLAGVFSKLHFRTPILCLPFSGPPPPTTAIDNDLRWSVLGGPPPLTGTAAVLDRFNFYFGLIEVGVGMVGNLLCIATLSRRKFRSVYHRVVTRPKRLMAVKAAGMSF